MKKSCKLWRQEQYFGINSTHDCNCIDQLRVSNFILFDNN